MYIGISIAQDIQSLINMFIKLTFLLEADALF